MRNLRDYLWADSPTDALQKLAVSPGRGTFLGGGTALMARNDPELDFVIDLSRAGLDGVSHPNGELVLGSTTSLETILADRRACALANGVLGAALAATRTEPWRRQATLAGRLLEGDPSDLLTPCLLVLDAVAEVLRPGESSSLRMPLDALLAETRSGAPTPLVLSIRVPRIEPGFGFALEWLGRSALDPALAGAVAGLRLAAGRIAAARVATTALPAPRRAPHVEQALGGARSDDFGAALDQLDVDILAGEDWRASPASRAELARVLLGRALRRASDAAHRSSGD
jgi:aerobic carbon-monoxide dehydrogenase medium subunit